MPDVTPTEDRPRSLRADTRPGAQICGFDPRHVSANAYVLASLSAALLLRARVVTRNKLLREVTCSRSLYATRSGRRVGLWPPRHCTPQCCARPRRRPNCPSAPSRSRWPELLGRAAQHELFLPPSARGEQRQRPACFQPPSGISAFRIDGAGLLQGPASIARDSCSMSSRSTAPGCRARRERWRRRVSASVQNGRHSSPVTSCSSRSPVNASATWPSMQGAGASFTRHPAGGACATMRSTRSEDDGSRGGSSPLAVSHPAARRS